VNYTTLLPSCCCCRTLSIFKSTEITMKSSCTGLGAGGGGHRGVFCRLQVAGCWLRAVQKQTGQEHEGGDCDWGGLAHQLQHFCLADCEYLT
jgi:hypothetical protein